MENMMIGGAGYYGNQSAQGLAQMAHVPTIAQRLDLAVKQAEERLAAVKRAKELLGKNPDLEELLNIMQRAHSENQTMSKFYPRFGATGRFPRGKADATDEGELTMGLAVDHANAIVRIVFGKPIAWVGIPSGQARELAAALIEKADELDKRKP